MVIYVRNKQCLICQCEVCRVQSFRFVNRSHFFCPDIDNEDGSRLYPVVCYIQRVIVFRKCYALIINRDVFIGSGIAGIYLFADKFFRADDAGL